MRQRVISLFACLTIEPFSTQITSYKRSRSSADSSEQSLFLHTKKARRQSRLFDTKIIFNLIHTTCGAKAFNREFQFYFTINFSQSFLKTVISSIGKRKMKFFLKFDSSILLSRLSRYFRHKLIR